jgi:phosphotransferase system HPr-like phosphotransfer protein
VWFYSSIEKREFDMKEKKIMLPTIEAAKQFVTEAGKCDFDIDIFYNRITIDAKSILGVLSLDLTRVLTVQFNGENEAFEAYLETVAPKNEEAA